MKIILTLTLRKMQIIVYIQYTADISKITKKGKMKVIFSHLLWAFVFGFNVIGKDLKIQNIIIRIILINNA